MENYTTKIGVYDARTRILIGTYELSCESRCKRISEMRAMAKAKDIYRAARLAELANRYGGVIYRLAEDGLIDPISIYDFCIIK